MRHDRTVIGYHGCDVAVAERLLAGDAFAPSNNDFDWLGRGVYFWEYGADRALRFAEEQRVRGKVSVPAIVGAVRQLGECFDLLDTHFTSVLAADYLLWEATTRALDTHARRATVPYDSVRGGFTEGDAVFPKSGLQRETHVQVAIRNPSCILGVFRPTPTGRTP